MTMEDCQSVLKKPRLFPTSSENLVHEIDMLRCRKETDKLSNKHRLDDAMPQSLNTDERKTHVKSIDEMRDFSQVTYCRIIDVEMKNPDEFTRNSTIANEIIHERNGSRSVISQKIAAKILDESRKAEQLLLTERAHDRYPCPAKKMGPSHNRTTAFLKIQPNTPHGMPLLCSHALCRKGRLKFVFCQYCNQPVSRMKFEQRHAHPEHLLLALSDSCRSLNPIHNSYSRNYFEVNDDDAFNTAAV